MRWLLIVLLVAPAPGCCCTAPGAGAVAGYPAFAAPSSYEPCRGPDEVGYRRPCYPAYRPIGSASRP